MKKYIKLNLLIITVILLLVYGNCLLAQAPHVQVMTSGTKTNLRGLSVVNDNIIWVSGSNATVGRSVNGGKNWNWMIVRGFEKADFRDIEAFDANTAIIMAVDSPAHILKTIDGGSTWVVVYENRTSGMFLDAMDFSDRSNGIVVGDPQNDRVFIARSFDNGSSWKELVPENSKPLVDSGEAFFAASGTNIRLFRNKSYLMVSGGTRSRLISNSASADLQIIQGLSSTGANSLDIYDNGNPDRPGKRMAVVGGDFNKPASTEKNFLYTINAGKTWKPAKIPPHGYRSCIEYLSQKDLISCGINGVDYSRDGGKTWKWISKEGFHVCRIARNGSAFYLAGANGKVARLNWE